MKRIFVIAVAAFLCMAHSAFCFELPDFSRLTDAEIQYYLETAVIRAEKYDAKQFEAPRRIDFCNTDAQWRKKSYFISPMVPAENQGKNECAGFASSYVCRFYGQELGGKEAYDAIAPKNDDGTVNPLPLRRFWDAKREYRTFVFTGTVDDLKDAVSHNIPVIVLISCKGGYHYVPVVGYDKKYIYIQDSIPSFRNVRGKEYNRREKIARFEKLWNIQIPYCDHLMFVITE